MANTWAAAALGVLVLGGCSRLSPQDVPGAMALEDTQVQAGDFTLDQAESSTPALTQEISLDDLLTALDDLQTPQPVKTTLIMQQQEDSQTAVGYESRTSDPSTSVTYLSVDYSEVAAMYQAILGDMLEEQPGAQDQVDEETTEDYSPALAGVIAGMSLPVDYFVDQDSERDTIWIRVADEIALNRAEIQSLRLLYDDNEEVLAGLAYSESLIVDLPALREKWFSEPLYEGRFFPAGLGPELALDSGSSLLYSVGFRDGVTPGDLVLIERSRDSQRIVIEISQVDQEAFALLEFNADKKIIALEIEDGTQRFEFDWNPDLSVLELPPVELQLSEADIESAYETSSSETDPDEVGKFSTVGGRIPATDE